MLESICTLSQVISHGDYSTIVTASLLQDQICLKFVGNDSLGEIDYTPMTVFFAKHQFRDFVLLIQRVNDQLNKPQQLELDFG